MSVSARLKQYGAFRAIGVSMGQLSLSLIHILNYYCAAGRIPGAVKMAGIWLIPKNAEKPIDGRTKQGKELKHE